MHVGQLEPVKLKLVFRAHIKAQFKRLLKPKPIQANQPCPRAPILGLVVNEFANYNENNDITIDYKNYEVTNNDRNNNVLTMTKNMDITDDDKNHKFTNNDVNNEITD